MIGADIGKGTSLVHNLGEVNVGELDTKEFCQDNARRWASRFMDEWYKRGWSMVDFNSMVTWFSDAIETAYHYRIDSGMCTDNGADRYGRVR